MLNLQTGIADPSGARGRDLELEGLPLPSEQSPDHRSLALRLGEITYPILPTCERRRLDSAPDLAALKALSAPAGRAEFSSVFLTATPYSTAEEDAQASNTRVGTPRSDQLSEVPSAL